MGKIFCRKAIETIFADEDSKDENFDCRSHLDIIPYEENKGDSELGDLDIQTEGLKIFGNPMKLKVLQERTMLM